MSAPSEGNMIELYWDAGLTFNGLLDARPHDMLGIGFAYIGVSSQIIDYSKEQGFPVIPSFEGRLEISYTAQLMQGLTLQPDFQYFWNPGGHSGDPDDPDHRDPQCRRLRPAHHHQLLSRSVIPAKRGAAEREPGSSACPFAFGSSTHLALGPG